MATQLPKITVGLLDAQPAGSTWSAGASTLGLSVARGTMGTLITERQKDHPTRTRGSEFRH